MNFTWKLTGEIVRQPLGSINQLRNQLMQRRGIPWKDTDAAARILVAEAGCLIIPVADPATGRVREEIHRNIAVALPERRPPLKAKRRP